MEKTEEKEEKFQVATRVNQETRKAVMRVAMEEERSTAWVLEQALKLYLEDYEARRFGKR